MIEIGSRARRQAPPAHVIFEALLHPDLGLARSWLVLLDDERPPQVLRTSEPTLVTWSSIWVKRPDAQTRFDLARDAHGTSLRWTLFVDDPVPDDTLTGHMRKRMNRLINADLRFSFGQ